MVTPPAFWREARHYQSIMTEQRSAGRVTVRQEPFSYSNGSKWPISKDSSRVRGDREDNSAAVALREARGIF